MLDDLRANKIEYVITYHRQPYFTMEADARFSAEVQTAIVENYHVVLDYSKEAYGFVIYKANKN